MTSFRKAWQEIRTAKAHLEAHPPPSGPEEAFERLVAFSHRAQADYTIEGDAVVFTLESKAWNGFWLASSAVIVGMGWPIAAALTAPSRILPWLVTVVLLVVLVGLVRYGPSTYRTTCDRRSQALRFESNHVLGRYIRPVLLLPFSAVVGFSAKVQSGSGMCWHRISIRYGDEKRLSLLNLPNGPLYYVNHHAFLESLQVLLEPPVEC